MPFIQNTTNTYRQEHRAAGSTAAACLAPATGGSGVAASSSPTSMDWLEAVALAAAAGTGTSDACVYIRLVSFSACLRGGGCGCMYTCGAFEARSLALTRMHINAVAFPCSSRPFAQHDTTPKYTGWAAANRLLSSPHFDFGLLLGMALGASLVILLLKARGQDVAAPARAAADGEPSGGVPSSPAAPAHLARDGSLGGRGSSGGSKRGASGGSAGAQRAQHHQQHHHAGPANNATATPTSSASGAGGGGGVVSGGGGGGPIGVLRRLSSHAGMGRDRSLDGSGSQVRRVGMVSVAAGG